MKPLAAENLHYGAFRFAADLDDLPPPARAAIGACLAKRSDTEPMARENWPALLAKCAPEWTDFAMTTMGLQFRAARSTVPRGGVFYRPQKIYWVFAGNADAELPDRPLSCHRSLALAAEMMMAFYGEVCAGMADS
ncbi:MAG TPA: hypothetical protein VMU17_04680 [Elusimicrobiota bacterium]|nr:hypothetical protein [Elusimicrobiota bacterium]